MVAQMGNLEWARLVRALRDGWKRLWGWSISLYGNSVRAPLLGNLDR